MSDTIYNESLRKKLFKRLFISTSIVVFVWYIAIIIFFLNEKREASLSFAKEASGMISQDFAKLVFLKDVYTANDITEKLHYFKNIKQVILYNKNEKTPIYIYQNKNLKGHFLEYHFPISYKRKEIGTISILVKYEAPDDIIKEYWPYMLLFYIILVISIFLFIRYFSNIIIKPILNLVKFLEGIEFTSSLSKRVPNRYKDEIGKLYNQVNIMLGNIQKSIQDKEQAQEEINKLKHYDALTGLMQKNIFLEKIPSLLSKNQKHLVLCLNIQNFKMINDIYSHKIGDELLIEMANRLKEDFQSYNIARIGVDEFVIFINDFKNYKNTESIINLLLSERYKQFIIEDKFLNIKLYIGINIINSDYLMENFLKECDLSINLAKKSPNHLAFFDKKLEEKILKDFILADEIKKALENNHMKMFYQLQYNADGTIYGAESLIRWIHPEKGVIPPNEFIPIAEESDLIIQMGDFTLKEAFKRLSIWQENEKTRDWVLAVNMHSKQFDDSLITKLKNYLKEYKIEPSKLKIELLESMFFGNAQENIERMYKIKNLGFSISLDDFGTGFSSLQYLKHFPIDQIKIDQSFVFSMLKDDKDLIIVEYIINLAKGLGINVIAEGVETKEHFEKLKEMECKLFQGYYFAKPQPIEEIMKKIQ